MNRFRFFFSLKSTLTLFIIITYVTFTSVANAQPFSGFNFVEGAGDFEADWNADGIADEWHTWQAAGEPEWGSIPGLTQTLDSTTYYKNTSSVKIRFDNCSTSSRLMLNYDFSDITCLARPGQRLTIGYMLKTSADINNMCFSFMIEYDSGGERQYRWYDGTQLRTLDGTPGMTLTPNMDWRRYTIIWDVPNDATYIKLWFNTKPFTPGAATGTLWMDDVYVTDNRAKFVPKTYTAHHWLCFGTTNLNPLLAMEKNEGGIFGQDTALLGMQRYRGADAFVVLHVTATYCTFDGTENAPNRCFTYTELLRDHPDWLLRDTDGNLIRDVKWVAVDIGNTDLQELYLQRMRTYLTRMKQTWVFFDGFDIHNTCNLSNKTPQKYQTHEAWQAAVLSFINNVVVPLQADGRKVMFNLAHADWNTEPGSSWMTKLDGALFEWGVYHHDKYDPYTTWKYKYFSQIWRTDKYYVTNIHADENEKAPRRFGLATYLLGVRPYSYISLNDDSDDYKTYRHADLEVDLGAPLETFTPTGNTGLIQGDIETGGLFKRSFEKGVVLVNPTGEATTDEGATYTDGVTYTYNLADAYRDLDGNIIGPGVVTIPPKSALILLKSAKLNVTLTAAPINPAPSEVVTYTIQYSNSGSAAAVNPVLTLPLPSEVEFVTGSITGGGTYNSTTHRVTWTWSQLAPGGTQTVTCQVRVK